MRVAEDQTQQHTYFQGEHIVLRLN
jgi:hypothetical protein